MVDKSVFRRWVKEYIQDLDLSKIEYITLTEEELKEFFIDNYFDEETQAFVSREGDKYRPIGLTFIAFDNLVTNSSYEKSKKYLLGVCKNNKGTKTIVSSIKYFDEYYHMDEGDPLTFIATIETNQFFRNMGLCKKIIEQFSLQINMCQPLIITEESPLGKTCKVINHVKNSLYDKGYNERVQTVGEFTNEYYNNQLRMLLNK